MNKLPSGLPRKQLRDWQISTPTNQYHRNTKGEVVYVTKLEVIENLIRDAHLLGNFLAETTYNRLKKDHYWLKMWDDVIKFVNKCEPCKRNHLAIPKEHCAKATAIQGIFDRIGIDLFFGLPVTAEGYAGIFVIIEYLPKHASAETIKNRTKALGNIGKGRKKQMKAQNKAHTIQTETLPLGTNVWIKIMSLHDKLHPNLRR
ncbi:gag-pol fusion [Brachionus plicatilis]|uniref:Gag-pol fusion n=1 Tax=Brachionus plicatilis TaxID=10195 RepID=A0A3M7PLJ4_BRAPC|nr:gag-pol fusion [Brachionus plicatilis]